MDAVVPLRLSSTLRCIGGSSEAAGHPGWRSRGERGAALMMMAPLTPAFFWMIGEEDRPRASFPCAHAQRGRVR